MAAYSAQRPRKDHAGSTDVNDLVGLLKTSTSSLGSPNDAFNRAQRLFSANRGVPPLYRQANFTQFGRPLMEKRFYASPQGNDDLARWQFWPTKMWLGSLTGPDFTRLFGGSCEYGPDQDRKGHGHSLLAFDFERENLVMRAVFQMPQQKLPPAFTPLDAQLRFSDISRRGIHIVQEKRGAMWRVVVTVNLLRPPKFNAKFDENLCSPNGERVYKRRATLMDFVLCDVAERRAGVLRAIPEGPMANPTFWNTYRWEFELDNNGFRRFRQCAARLQMLGEEDPEKDLLSQNKREWTRTRQLESEWKVPDLSRLDFASRALVEGLIGHGIVRPIDVANLLNALDEFAKALPFRQRLLTNLFAEERIRNVHTVVQARAASLRRGEFPVSQHLVMIRTVTVTPTRVLVGPPLPETSNSVTRRYADKLDAVIRVHFTDEGERLHIQKFTKLGDDLCPEKGLMARVRRALQYGVEVAGRRFYPVASSSSQQKDHNMWFIDHTVIDRPELSRWMGQVKEQVVAKHAARLGLPFSASRAVNLKVTVSELADIFRNDHCFTDGCGMAGIDVMRQAARSMGSKPKAGDAPSAVQFRLGGAKGVLTYWPGKVGDSEILMRPSQTKFESNLKELNVVRIAKYQAAFLNRQFINIMSACGVPDELFKQLFFEAAQAIEGLANRAIAKSLTKDDLIILQQFTEFPLVQIINAGFATNPMIRDLCRLVQARALQDLKWRARVKIDKGVYLIGVADETGLLKEGEVFCQYQINPGDKPVVITGPVLVCRAPALHPGDVRTAHAANYEPLRHLKNVVVFSTQGERPLPNMLGGGDLDGDDFTIIWDQRFVKYLRLHEPMDYTAPPPKKVKQVTQYDLNECFVQYILNDILGQVDNCHLALSDQFGPTSKDCLKLAEIHSTAVDFAKTGIAAELEPDLRPSKWPDFMGKPPLHSYTSQKVLGVLFRRIESEPNFEPSDLRLLWFEIEPFFHSHPQYHEIMIRLIGVKIGYECDMHFAMRRFRATELEIVSGIVTYTKARKTARDVTNISESLKDHYQQITDLCREQAKKCLQGFILPTKYTAMQIIAAHAYRLTYEHRYVKQWDTHGAQAIWGPNAHSSPEDTSYLQPKPMVSFAWVFRQELVELAQLSSL